MSRNVIPGPVLVGLSLIAACVIATPMRSAAAETIGTGQSGNWKPTVSTAADNGWTNLSIDKRPRGSGRYAGSDRSDGWYGPSGWRAILSVEYASPFDKDGSSATSGSGAELALVTPSPQGLGLRLSLGWSGIDVDDDRNWAGDGVGAPLPPYVHVVDQRKSMDAFRTFFSLQYRTFPPRNVPNVPEFTVFGGIGFITHDMHAETTIANDSPGQFFWYADDKTEATPALTLGCAGSVMFTPRVGVEASLSTDILLNEDDYFTADGMHGFDSMHDYDGSWAWRVGLILAF
ncbi:MAG: hypothetical protein PHR28_06340 [candidate division Zixibacteria bacterium]|nr:hypothetical protein [candidate division Zixibacteria bacterium]